MRQIYILFCTLILLCGMSYAVGQEKIKAEAGKKASLAKETTIKGEVVEISCYLARGGKGENHRECGIACGKSGSPLGILTKDGKLYVSVLPDDHSNGPNAMLLDHVSHQIEATGIIRERSGMKGIMITKVAMADGAQPEAKKIQ